MTDHTDRSTTALLARRAIAAQATPGPWWMDSAPWFVPLTYTVRCKAGNVTGLNAHEDAAHIAANSPHIVQADIDEILRLRAEVEQVEREANWLAQKIIERSDICGARKCTMPRNCVRCQREAARKAVEEQCPKN